MSGVRDRAFSQNRSSGVGGLGDERSSSGCVRVRGLGDQGGWRRCRVSVRGGLGDDRGGIGLGQERAGISGRCGVGRLGQNRCGRGVSVMSVSGFGDHRWSRMRGVRGQGWRVSGFGDNWLCGDQGLGQGRRGVRLGDHRSGVADGVLLQQIVAHVAVAHAHRRGRGVFGPAVRGHHVLTRVALLRGLLAVADAAVITGQCADVVRRRSAGICHCHEDCQYHELR